MNFNKALGKKLYLCNHKTNEMAIIIKMEEVNNLMATLPSINHDNAEEALPQLQAFCPTIPAPWVEGVVNTHVRKELNAAIGK